MTKKTLQDFAKANGGIKWIARRHFEYRIPVPVTQTAADNNAGEIGAMVYTRHIAPEKLGLNAAGACGAMMHGEKLAHWGLIPSVIYHGRDQRNFDGAWLTAEAIERATKEKVTCLENPAVTYPVYRDIQETSAALAKYGDPAVHQTLAGSLHLWTESPQTFFARICGAINDAEEGVLWDLNFEAIVLMYYVYVASVKNISRIPSDKMAWIPLKGSGIVMAKNGAVTVFDRELNIT